MKTTIMGNLLVLILLIQFTGCSKEDDFLPEKENTSNKSTGIFKGGDYYVAPWGKDTNPGTYDLPWGSWQKAFSTADAGDTVYFRGGVYYPTVTGLNTPQEGGNGIIILDPVNEYPPGRVGHNGTAEAPICYFNYPGEEPILDGSKIDPKGRFNVGIQVYFTQHINFRGLTIRNIYQKRSGVTATGMEISGGMNFTYENMTFHNIGGKGIYHKTGWLPGPDTIRFINCDAYNCADSLSSIPGNGADGFKLDQTYGHTYAIFEGCRSYHNSDDGFDASGYAKIIYRNCWSFENGYMNPDNGVGFKLNGISRGDTVNRIAINNISAFNLTGFDENNGSKPAMNGYIYNNITYRNNIGYRNEGHHTGEDKNNVYKNNISYKDKAVAEWGNRFLGNNNSWDLPGELSDSDFLDLRPEQLKAPRNADGSLPDITFLKLSNNSKLIDAGEDVGLPYKGSAPDLGAFEVK